MGTKANPQPNDCYMVALPDEPMFVLLARDTAAPATIEAWIKARMAEMLEGKRPLSDMDMLAEAQKCAELMRGWRADNFGRWRGCPPRPIV